MSAPEPMKLNEYIMERIAALSLLDFDMGRDLDSDDVQRWIHKWYNLHGHIHPVTFGPQNKVIE